MWRTDSSRGAGGHQDLRPFVASLLHVSGVEADIDRVRFHDREFVPAFIR
jgi:hypothetical protein